MLENQAITSGEARKQTNKKSRIYSFEVKRSKQASPWALRNSEYTELLVSITQEIEVP